MTDEIRSVGLLNERYEPDEELLVEQYSGHPDDLSARAHEVMDDEHFIGLDYGDWIIIVDGEVVEIGEFHPHRIHIEL